ncbi:MAG: hypothetical protein KY455_10100 [Euryarchaeota archaeon]|nr:hypothetical protein [Euryarchaeota archaeon]
MTAFIRIGNGDVAVSGCNEHVRTLIERNRAAMDIRPDPALEAIDADIAAVRRALTNLGYPEGRRFTFAVPHAREWSVRSGGWIIVLEGGLMLCGPAGHTSYRTCCNEPLEVVP